MLIFVPQRVVVGEAPAPGAGAGGVAPLVRSVWILDELRVFADQAVRAGAVRARGYACRGRGISAREFWRRLPRGEVDVRAGGDLGGGVTVMMPYGDAALNEP